MRWPQASVNRVSAVATSGLRGCFQFSRPSFASSCLPSSAIQKLLRQYAVARATAEPDSSTSFDLLYDHNERGALSLLGIQQ
eukprot:6207383-Pleurochrysis_carterae.AAC.1